MNSFNYAEMMLHFSCCPFVCKTTPSVVVAGRALPSLKSRHDSTYPELDGVQSGDNESERCRHSRMKSFHFMWASNHGSSTEVLFLSKVNRTAALLLLLLATFHYSSIYFKLELSKSCLNPLKMVIRWFSWSSTPGQTGVQLVQLYRASTKIRMHWY